MRNKIVICYLLMFTLLNVTGSIAAATAITSIDTGENTIMRVRTAQDGASAVIIGGAHDGTVVAASFDGKMLWEKQYTNGTLVHDIWCEDLDGDNKDEILVANANGHLYCLNIDGSMRWDFTVAESCHLTPMYTVCVVHDSKKVPYVVCGDFSTDIYYINADGTLKKTIPSKGYSKQKPWGNNIPEANKSIAVYLRPVPQSDGSDFLLVYASCNQMQVNGELHLMRPLESTSFFYKASVLKGGDVRVVDGNNDGHYDILIGNQSLDTYDIVRTVFNDNYTQAYNIRYRINKKGTVSYRVSQPFVMQTSSTKYFAALSSDQIAMFAYSESGFDSLSSADEQNVTNESRQVFSKYTYNDIWDCGDGRLLVASSQDGGSCIHIFNFKQNSWETEYKNLVPIGKISKMKSSLNTMRQQLALFTKPSWQRAPVKAIVSDGDDTSVAKKYSDCSSIGFNTGKWHAGVLQDTTWRRPLYEGNAYCTKLDTRNKYTRTEDETVNFFTSAIDDKFCGLQFWGGHGNDPLYWSLSALKRIAEKVHSKGKTLSLTWPELNVYDSDFKFVLKNHFYPLMDIMQPYRSNVALRAKDVFWLGHIYTDTWAEVLSGKYADAVVPLMEETTDKTQDMSIAARMGLWESGVVNAWGVRCSRDDPSFDRMRQFSSQKLSNHFLRKTIYALASGASHIHNVYPDSQNKNEYKEHSSFVLELVQKEALYIPKREELLSLSPVHIAMVHPSESFLNEASNNKWTTFYNKDKEEHNPAVFSHMNGSWLGAALTPWDYSTYASGVVDRRVNPIPPTPNGMVLITPVQDGYYALKDQPRGRLEDHLNPIYKGKLKEYITDGVDYLSADGIETFSADTYYENVARDIEEGAKMLPVQVSGDNVGWVVAQMDPTHLRLTLVDGGFLDPKDRNVKVKFNGIHVCSMTDILDNTDYVTDGTTPVDVTIPCGMFRFIDIEIANTNGVENVGMGNGGFLKNNYPNPVDDVTKVEYGLPACAKSAFLNVYNAMGMKVMSEKLPVSQSSGTVTLERNGLPAGVYVNRLEVDGRCAGFHKMILK